MKNEETLALILEEINKKLDVIINEQKDIKEKIEKNHIIAMKRINKLQEYNEIDEMRVQLLNETCKQNCKSSFRNRKKTILINDYQYSLLF